MTPFLDLFLFTQDPRNVEEARKLLTEKIVRGGQAPASRFVPPGLESRGYRKPKVRPRI